MAVRTQWGAMGLGAGVVMTRGRAPQNGCTPLYAAAQNGHEEAVHFLVEAGADLTAKSNVSGWRLGGKRQEVGERRDYGER